MDNAAMVWAWDFQQEYAEISKLWNRDGSGRQGCWRRDTAKSDVACRVGVHRQSVSQWAAELQQKGRAGLKRAGRAGRKPQLDAVAIHKIEQGLKRRPEALGYTSGLWSSARVAHPIETECGVRYHPGHVWRILRQLGWSCQPTGRALERNEEKIRQWKQQRWPKIKKKARNERRTIVFIDES